MRLRIKYDTVAFRAAETCQECHLFSDSIAGKRQFKAGVCLYLGRFSIFALFRRGAEHYFLSIVLQEPSFISEALLFSHSLAVPLCYFVTLSHTRLS